MKTRYRLSKAQQKTVIQSSAAEQEWDVMTADPRFIRHLRRQGYEPGQNQQFREYFACKLPFRKLRIAKRVRLTAAWRKRPWHGGPDWESR